MYLIPTAQLGKPDPSSFTSPSKTTLMSKLFYHDIMVTYSPGTEVFKFRIRKKECNPEMCGYDSIKRVSALDCFGLPKKRGHRPHV